MKELYTDFLVEDLNLDNPISPLNDNFNKLFLYENVHTRMSPLVCDTNNIMYVV